MPPVIARSWVNVAAIVMCLAALVPPAGAAEPGDDEGAGRSVCTDEVRNELGNVIGCRRRAFTSESTESSVTEEYTDPEYPDWEPPADSEWAVWIAWGTRGDGSACYYTEGMWVPEGDGAAVSAANTIENELMKQWQRNGIGDPPACVSISEILAGGPPAMPSQAVLWDEILAHLPRPNPLWIAPGEAITGLPAWLETNRDLTFELPPSGLAAMPGGMVSVTAEADFTVDWGDPSPHDESDPDHVYTSEGIPPPDDISLDHMYLDHPDSIQHTYTVVPESGEASITVTDHWTVTFEDQWGRTATADGDLTTSETFPIIELQAVVTD